MTTIRRIEINFPEAVELTGALQQRLEGIASEICRAWQAQHPGRVMWPFGTGLKITYMPMTAEEEKAGRHMEFDEDIFEISVSERADYKWPCARCGFEQGDHKDHILQPKAGACEFQPKPRETAR